MLLIFIFYMLEFFRFLELYKRSKSMTGFLVIIFMLLIIIIMLIALAVAQIKMAGMKVKDFWSFVKGK